MNKENIIYTYTRDNTHIWYMHTQCACLRHAHVCICIYYVCICILFHTHIHTQWNSISLIKIPSICDYMNETGKHQAKWNKPDIEQLIFHEWLKCVVFKFYKKKATLTVTEIRLVLTRDKGKRWDLRKKENKWNWNCGCQGLGSEHHRNYCLMGTELYFWKNSGTRRWWWLLYNINTSMPLKCNLKIFIIAHLC